MQRAIRVSVPRDVLPTELAGGGSYQGNILSLLGLGFHTTLSPSPSDWQGTLQVSGMVVPLISPVLRPPSPTTSFPANANHPFTAKGHHCLLPLISALAAGFLYWSSHPCQAKWLSSWENVQPKRSELLCRSPHYGP